SGPSATWIAASLFIVTLVGYLGTFMTIPVYLFLVRRRCPSFWLAPVVGFLAGGVTHAGFYALLALMLGYSASGMGQLFDQEFRGMLQETAWPYGPLGALVGCVLWLIAR